MSGLTANVRHQGTKEGLRKDALRELRRDVIELLSMPQFRRYANHITRGRLGHGGTLWRTSVADMAWAVTRSDAGGELLRELQELDPQGFVLLMREHETRIAEELLITAKATEEPDDD